MGTDQRYGRISLDRFESLLGPRTKMVAITHMSNVLGTIVPIKRRSSGSRTPAQFRCWSTAARQPVHMPVDVRDLDCDFYAFTGHKTYGPSGIGVLYAKRRHLDAMPPYMGAAR